MKSIFISILALLSVTQAWAETFTVDGIRYSTTDYTAAVTGTTIETGDVVIPSYVIYNDVVYNVTSIKSLFYGAFEGRSGLTSITIPNSVTSIGNNAFKNCSGLTSVTLPNGLTSIGSMVFYGCSGLTSITIPNSVTSIDAYAFAYSGLTSVSIPKGVTSIDGSAFDYCSQLSTITVDSRNTVYDSREGCNAIIETASNALVLGSNTTVIPEGVTSIGSFVGRSGLTSITIPESVIYLPSGQSFRGCSSLVSITVKEGNQYIDSREGCNAIITKYGNYNYLLVGCKTTVIPESVKAIGAFAFSGCSGLTSITIPEGVTSIERDAFHGCSGLTSINIPEGVTSIEDYSFMNCSGLTSVTIPEGVTSIGQYAFDGCSGLRSIAIPEGVTSIGYRAFYGCSGLTSVTIPKSVTSIKDAVFQGCTELVSISIEDGNSVYDSREGCNAIIESATNTLIYGCKATIIPDGVTSIKYSAFSGCSDLASITIPEGVKSIGVYAFQDCSTLTSVIIPKSVTAIGGGAFWGCSGLTSVTIPEGVASIGWNAFEYCSALTSVTMEREEPVEYSSLFSGISDDCVLTVPYGTRDAYIAAGWTEDIFKGGVVEAQPQADVVNVTMSSLGMCTFSSNSSLDFSEVSGLKAYIVSGFSPSTGVLTLTPVTNVPAGEGLVLKGNTGSYEIPVQATDMFYSNLLKGVTETTEIAPTDGTMTNLILANGKYGVSFYTLSATGNIAAGKAYLQLPTSALPAQAKSLTLVFEDETVTGISNVNDNENGGAQGYFNLSGQRVGKPAKNGLYIVNGKKVFVK